ncbi:thioesterase II family protein [Actinoplanes sp. GCM10030250]|uniref:thioesterase II family protein n=1 Tax=Actinoplanes sp. GCM10030250 TaxID=3273376 RepID=UPI0036092B1B
MVDHESWVRCFSPQPGAAIRLACFAHAGGSASFFFPFAEALAPHVEVLGMQYPGRLDRYADPSLDSMLALAEEAGAALAHWSDRPLALFGHSMGATVGFEVARRMQHRDGAPVVTLFASGRRSPSLPDRLSGRVLDDRQLLAELELSASAAALLEDEDVRQMMMPAIRADYRAIASYRYDPEPRLSCPVVSLIGDRDPKVSVAEAGTWDAVTDGPFDLRVFPGGHFYLGDRVEDVAAAVLDALGVRRPVAG